MVSGAKDTWNFVPVYLNSPIREEGVTCTKGSYILVLPYPYFC